MKFIKWLISMSLLICLIGCKSNKHYHYYNTVFSGPFDTVIYYNAYTHSEAKFNEQVSLLKETFTTLDHLFDRYTSYEGINNIKTINDMAGIEAVSVDPIIIDLLDKAMNEYSKISNKVNVALGSVLDLWHEARVNATLNSENVLVGKVPATNDLVEASKYCDASKVIIDKENNTVYLEDPKMKLDVGAIAKGYAVEYVKKVLIENGAESFIISAGGNVASYGTRKVKSNKMTQLPRSENEFTTGINSPKNGAYSNYGDIVAVVVANNQSIVTSGDYERYFIDSEGKTYSHLIDPVTLQPATNFRSVTIICEDSGLADYLSTALFLYDYTLGRALIDELEGVEAIWLMNDGTIIHTDGLVEGDNFYSVIKS